MKLCLELIKTQFQYKYEIYAFGMLLSFSSVFYGILQLVNIYQCQRI